VVFAVAEFLWIVAGHEQIVIDWAKLSIARHIPMWTRAVDCTFDDARNLRAIDVETKSFRNPFPNWYSLRTGTVRLDFGVHTLGFGIDLDAAEARQVVDAILSVYPDLAAPERQTGA
jgi:hypothetical protein